MTSSETTFNDEELLIWLRVEDTNLTDFAADRIEALTELLATTNEQRDKAWESLLHWRNKSFGLEEKLALMTAERDEAWKRAAHAEKMWGEAEVKLEKAVEALLWCSGSADFNEGGVAREGWLKVCAPLLKGESHDPL